MLHGSLDPGDDLAIDSLHVDDSLELADGADGDGGLAGALNPLSSIPALNSNSGAGATLYLDFNGHFESVWGGYSNVTTPVYDVDGDTSTFSDAELAAIRDIWKRVAEDFAPFNINVTTVDPGNFSNGVSLRVSIGGDGSWIGPYGGVAYVNSFTNSIANTVYVFSENLGNGYSRYVAEAVSHEAGHAFGLQHQSLYSGSTLVQSYYTGTAEWAPIMGVGYYSTRTTWHDGTTISSIIFQDDMSVIANARNGFGYRTDDHGGNVYASTDLTANGLDVDGSGIVERMNDVDYFSFTTGSGEISFTIDMLSAGFNLDAVMELRTASGTLLTSVSTGDTGTATFTITLAAGDYTLAIRGTGEYGNVGQYWVSGTVATDDFADPDGPTFDLVGDQLTVNGTDGDDLFEFYAGATHEVRLNGAVYMISAANVKTITFVGGKGTDRSIIVGTSGVENAYLRWRAGSVLGVGFSVYLNSSERIELLGGAEDSVWFYDTIFNDTFTARPTSATMSGFWYYNKATGFGDVVAISSEGGTDRAVFYDSAGNDRFVAWSNSATMTGAGFSNTAIGFASVVAVANAGGTDVATLYDSAGNDLFVGSTGRSYMRGEGFLNTVRNFDRVNAVAQNGGFDTAILYDSAGNDLFLARPTYSFMKGTGFYNVASGFDRVNAYANAGGTDQATLVDSAGDDIFSSGAYNAYMRGNGFMNVAYKFERVTGYASQGTDTARFYDSRGNDLFVATPTRAYMRGQGFYNYTRNFDRVYGIANAGGTDTAKMYDADGNDLFVGSRTYAYMKSSAYYNYARGFDRVVAYSYGSGTDYFKMYSHDFYFSKYGSWS